MYETFTIPDNVDLDTVYFYATDNAFNTVAIKMSNIGKVAGYLDSYQGLSSMTSTNINLINTTDTAISGTVYVAYYDNAGKMVGIAKPENTKLEADKSKQMLFNSFDDTSSATEIRLFIWDNNISPLDTKKVFTIND